MPRTNRAGKTPTGRSNESSGGELRVLSAIKTMLGDPPTGEVWSGDDAAVVAAPGGLLLVTTDTMVEGVHADLALVGLDDLGWKAVTTAASDIAAMGGVPDHLLISVAAPPLTDMERLYAGVTAAAEAIGAKVVGGDLSTADQVVVVVTVVGHVADGAAPVLRSGASAGDGLFVTGPLGGAAAGLRRLRARREGLQDKNRGVSGPLQSGPLQSGPLQSGPLQSGTESRLVVAHSRPLARLAEGECARSCGATAMIDLSDGIASDVRRIAEASGVGVRLTFVPVAKGATEEDAICGGDDYELLFAAPDPDAVASAFDAADLRKPWQIGACVDDPTELTLAGGPLRDCGWEHPF